MIIIHTVFNIILVKLVFEETAPISVIETVSGRNSRTLVYIFTLIKRRRYYSRFKTEHTYILE